MFGLVKRSTEDPRLAGLTEFALALPEATRQIYGLPAQFLVRKKIFGYFLQNHHGDVLVAVTCKVSYGDNKTLAKARPGRFYLSVQHRFSALRLRLQSSRGSIVCYDSRPEESQGYRRRHARCQANRAQSILYAINR
jgi:hypothetical protein